MLLIPIVPYTKVLQFLLLQNTKDYLCILPIQYVPILIILIDSFEASYSIKCTCVYALGCEHLVKVNVTNVTNKRE